MCLKGASGAGAELLAAMPEADVRAYYIWVPMISPDDKAAALTSAQRFAEPRATHHWDGGRYLAHQMAIALGIEGRRSAAPDDDPAFAWDVYLAYRQGNLDIAAPDFWMHQLAVEHAPRLELRGWRAQVEQLVSEFR